ncbi:MAG TPA: ubiquinone biosynthesis protein UbiB [Planctomycetes bacterium]|nr:ubiquinone biosynthesis protein UbiB [Planctomycetota bacterium]
MLWKILSSTRDLGRLEEIGKVLLRYGFGSLVQRLGLIKALEKAGKMLKKESLADIAKMSAPERVCRAFEELGPTFVKLGQVLSSRVELLPPEWIQAFEKLQDQVEPLPFEALEETLREELGRAPSEVFSTIDKNPLAAGSIAQVHAATLQDGSEVVLKIRRPGIKKTIEADLRLLRHLAQLTYEEIPELRPFHPKEVLRQFERSLRSELDLGREAENALRIRKGLGGMRGILIPEFHMEWSGPCLNVQERIHGIPGRQVEKAREAGLDLPKMARIGARAVLKMILEIGLFHADPHGGNVFYLQGNRIALIDFGMVGRLSEARRREIVDFLFGLVSSDSPLVAETLVDWADEEAVEPEKLIPDIEGFLDTWKGRPLKDLHFAEMLGDLLQILRDHNLSLPPDLSMFFKVLLTLEGLGRSMNPEFQIIPVARPFLERAMQKRFSPEELKKSTLARGKAALDLLTGLPEDLRSLIKAAKRGRLRLHIQSEDLTRLTRGLSEASNRVTIGIILAAMIVGTSILAAFGQGGIGLSTRFLGFSAFLLSLVFGVWVLFSIHRSRK